MSSDAQEPQKRADASLVLRRRVEAAVSDRQTLESKTHLAETYNSLGDAQLRLANFAEAVANYRRALEFSPGTAETYNNLGSALRSLGRLDEAAAGFRQALEVNPDFARAHGNLGSVLRSQGHTAEAEASCRRALAVEPDLTPTLVLLAELRADQGDFSEAQALLERTIEVEPQYPQAWAGLARWRTMTRDDTEWLAQAQRIADSGLPPHQEVFLRYAIGKYFDDVQMFPQAFSSYQRANELEKRSKAKHHRELLTRAVDLLIRLYDLAWVTSPRDEASPSERPVFIIGMPRSGTTLVEQILASHPAVFGAGELPFWQTAMDTHEEAVLRAGTGHATLKHLADDYLRLLETLSPEAQRVIDKMQGNFMYLGWIRAALPRARIIHMRRDPIDTCLSIYFQHFQESPAYTNDLEDLAHYYAEYSRLMAHWRAILPADAMLEVPYEELVSDPEAWSRKLVAFVGLPWDSRCLDFHRTERTIITASKWQVRQKLTRTPVGRWHNYADLVGPLRKI